MTREIQVVLLHDSLHNKQFDVGIVNSECRYSDGRKLYRVKMEDGTTRFLFDDEVRVITVDVLEPVAD